MLAQNKQLFSQSSEKSFGYDGAKFKTTANFSNVVYPQTHKIYGANRIPG